ncbi:tetratricopeptide repeat protein [Flavobacterium jejuense]|uniref:Oxygen sensor histidine kinase NreB n=1 Tax=Flavobacterium jejuense TaxID=1544455 RepID=A0ABX0IUQ6_9FLAO|nr:sensor histidine kinase [Flavobacterium jejuense]NHN26875.1 tetratricopeptide repeat protein [Flavobacterium jejuense]
MNSLKKKLLFIAAIFIVAFSFGQNSYLEALKRSINHVAIDSSKNIINHIKSTQLSYNEKANFEYLKANYFKLINEDDLAYKNYLAAKKRYIILDSISKVAQINIEMVSLLLAIENNKIDYNIYIKEFLDYAKTVHDPKILSEGYMQLGKSFYNSNPKLSIDYFFKALKENENQNEEVYSARIMQNIGATYASDQLMKLDSALFFYDKAMKIYEKNSLNEYISYIYINRGVVYKKQQKQEKAISSFLKADSISVKEFKNKNKEIIYGFLANTYKENGNYKKAIEYLEKQKVYQDILDEKEQNKAIIDIDIKYKTVEKEKENKNLKAINFKNKITISISLLLLFLSVLIGFLSFKNLKNKKKIIEQQKTIEVNHLVNQLKENQLNEIDKMLAIQDKERQKIADELHDNLGSLLTILKINFETLNEQENNELLYDKTNQIIDEAYNEVRNIAHLKNSGVIGKEGLLLAVKKMAEKMSVPNKIIFNVIPSGLNNRIENTVEVLLFRIIQELATNCIKHANASEVNIYLNQYDNEINVMVEDNGKGFESNKIDKNDGIGLKNIERKVEQLLGTFTVDTKKGRGTTIIIDLPL